MVSGTQRDDFLLVSKHAPIIFAASSVYLECLSLPTTTYAHITATLWSNVGPTCHHHYYYHFLSLCR